MEFSQKGIEPAGLFCSPSPLPAPTPAPGVTKVEGKAAGQARSAPCPPTPRATPVWGRAHRGFGGWQGSPPGLATPPGGSGAERPATARSGGGEDKGRGWGPLGGTCRLWGVHFLQTPVSTETSRKAELASFMSLWSQCLPGVRGRPRERCWGQPHVALVPAALCKGALSRLDPRAGQRSGLRFSAARRMRRAAQRPPRASGARDSPAGRSHGPLDPRARPAFICMLKTHSVCGGADNTVVR